MSIGKNDQSSCVLSQACAPSYNEKPALVPLDKMHVLARSLEPHRILHTCSSHLAHCCLHWAAVLFVDTSHRSWETALGLPLLLEFYFSRDFTELKNEGLSWKPAKQTDFQFIGFLNPPILTVPGRKDILLNY